MSPALLRVPARGTGMLKRNGKKKDNEPQRTVGDFVVERLARWGVRRIYGYPGDGINGVLAGIQRAGSHREADALEFVQVAHEELAALMACAHAKFSGEIGVCLSTGGPGATHLLTGLYDA